MRYPRGTEGQRAAMWLEHTRRHGWKAVAAVETSTAAGGQVGTEQLYSAPLLGIAYGHCGAPGPVVAAAGGGGAAPDRYAGRRGRRADEQLLRTHRVAHPPRAQGRGLGEALVRRLLAGRGEAHVLLSTPEIIGEVNRAWRLYRRLGFTDLIRGYYFAGDPRAFAILGRSLPL